MVDLNINFERIFNYIPGALFGIISVAIGVFGDIMSAWLYPDYSIFKNMISDLGIGPGSHFFNTGVILSGFFGILFSLYFRKIFQENGGNETILKWGFISYIISCVSLIAIGVFPASRTNVTILYIHGIFALMCALSVIAYLCLFGYLIIKDNQFSNWLAYYGFFICILFMIFIFTWQPFPEWAANIGIISWTSIFSVYILYKGL
ncbi:MAG: DUF998 domain-containing protein [Promethearchaeota archaeon]